MCTAKITHRRPSEGCPGGGFWRPKTVVQPTFRHLSPKVDKSSISTFDWGWKGLAWQIGIGRLSAHQGTRRRFNYARVFPRGCQKSFCSAKQHFSKSSAPPAALEKRTNTSCTLACRGAQSAFSNAACRFYSPLLSTNMYQRRVKSNPHLARFHRGEYL